MPPFLIPRGAWLFPALAPALAGSVPATTQPRRPVPPPAASSADRLTFFRPGAVWPGRYWEEQGSGAGGDPTPAPPARDEPPLSGAERVLSGAFAVMCGFALLTFLALVALAHSPIVAN